MNEDHTPQENRESWEARYRGGRGEQGEQGQQGAQGIQGEGMSSTVRRAIVFLFVLTFALSGASYFLATSAVHRAVASRASVVQLCQLGNESRAQQITLWVRLIQISRPPPHQTPAEQAQRAKTIREFLAYVHQLFAPRDCAGALTQEASRGRS